MNNHILYNVQCNRVCLYVHTPLPMAYIITLISCMKWQNLRILYIKKKFPIESLWEENFTFKYALERQLMQKII